MKASLENLRNRAIGEVETSENVESLKAAEIKYLGRKGELTLLLHELKNVSAEERPTIGRLANEVKQAIESAIEEKRQIFEKISLEKNLSTEHFDVTLPGTKYDVGHIHPISEVSREVEQIFSEMGFSIMDGPEAESEYYNFELLNIPAEHPARDMQATFFVKDKHASKHGRLILRTHTSPVQLRTMERLGAPLRVIVPGRVFRYEATDASHDTTFQQVEGLMIDRHISLAHLKGVMQEFLTRLFKKTVTVRFRPGYFPFVEPGVELDIACAFCDQKGCRICKHSGWIEFMGAGMVHPNVLRAGKIDPQKFQGWAFGFGLTRLAMMRYGINDIRLLHSGDLRFLQQF